MVCLPVGLKSEDIHSYSWDGSFKTLEMEKAKAQIIECDTTYQEYQKLYRDKLGWMAKISVEYFTDTLIQCDTNWTLFKMILDEIGDNYIIDSIKVRFESSLFDSTATFYPSPNWEDSIKACREKILQVEEKYKSYNVNWDGTIWMYYKTLELNLLKLQLQIFILQLKLEGKE